VGHQGVITKLSKEADYILKNYEEVEAAGAKTRLQTIQTMLCEKWKILKELDEEVLPLCEVEEIMKEVEEADEIISRVLDVQIIIAEFRVKWEENATRLSEQGAVNVRTTSTNNTTNETPQTNASEGYRISSFIEYRSSISQGQVQANQNIVEQSGQSNGTSGWSSYCRPKLPKLVLSKFKGDIMNYRTFWDSFNSAVHRNPGLSKIDKFNYLNLLLEGRALRAIQGLTISEENYDAVVDILQQRFGKTQQTISAHMDELMKIPACTTNDKSSQLRYIYDKVSVHTRSLSSL
jgi:hypothetical protein